LAFNFFNIDIDDLINTQFIYFLKNLPNDYEKKINN
jgi:hypothetical protein